MKRTRALMTTALPAALVAALALTGCSSGGNGDSSQDCAVPGEASEALKIDGDLGAELTLTSDVPVTVTELERSVLIQGDGEALATGDSAVTMFTVFNGVTGETIAAASAATVTNDPDTLNEWAAETIACSAIGDRVAAVMPASDLLGEGGGESYDLEDTDAVIAVIDITNSVLSSAEGEEVEAPEGFPEVEFDDDGLPSITIPEGADAPTELQFATIIEGDGAEVAETDTVTINYEGVVWSNGEVFDSSWDSGSPYSGVANGFVTGFTQGLVGQKVGSRVIMIIPAADGYGEDTATNLSAVEATEDDVMVFVVDILATVPATTTAE